METPAGAEPGDSGEGRRNRHQPLRIDRCSDLHLKSPRPAFNPGFQPTLAAISDGLKPTIPANEPAFIRINLHSISIDPH
jgi:hypothetical protein